MADATRVLEPERWGGIQEGGRGAAPADASLAALAGRRGLLYGAATKERTLRNDPQFAAAFARECAILVPEYELKWSKLRPGPDRYDFGSADRLASFARAHGMRMRGHTLVWHKALPVWFDEKVTRDNAERILRDHIDTVVRRYAGAIHSWDVVNEAVRLEDRLPGRLRRSPWYDRLGPDYIRIAFEAAAKADPNARLVYNDYGVDYATRSEGRKREAVYGLLQNLVSTGTPIHALGIQSHLRGWERRFDPLELQSFLRAVAELGLEVYVTELDVSDQRLPATIAERDAIVARVYEEYLEAVLDVPQVRLVMTWGLSDRYTWLTEHRPRPDGQPVRPLPLDAELQAKPAWRAMARAFSSAADRGGV